MLASIVTGANEVGARVAETETNVPLQPYVYGIIALGVLLLLLLLVTRLDIER